MIVKRASARIRLVAFVTARILPTSFRRETFVSLSLLGISIASINLGINDSFDTHSVVNWETFAVAGARIRPNSARSKRFYASASEL